jgi:hypothetical protein
VNLSAIGGDGPVRTRSHRDHPSRFGHLIVNFSVHQEPISHLQRYSVPFLKAGAILFVNVPATIMTSLCLGLARNTTPSRS